MNVWIFQTGEPLQIDKGNSRPMRAINLSNSLLKKGHKVTLWSSCFFHQKKRFRSKSFKNIFVNKNFEIKLLPSPGYKKNVSISRMIDHFILALNLKKKLEIEKTMPDVAFVGYPPIETAYILTRWLKKKNVPILLDVKDLWPSSFIDNFSNFLKPLVYLIFFPYFFVAKKTIKNATSICAISQSYLNWSKKFSKRKKNKFDFVAQLTSQLDNLKINKKVDDINYAWLKKNNILDKKIFRIIFIGSFSRAFNFNQIFEAVEILKKEKIKCEFIFCGEGELFFNLKKLFKEHKNVKIIKHIDSTKIIALSKYSSVFIAPYKEEKNFIFSIPNKAIDSFSLKLPLLYPLKGELKNLILNNKAGMIYNNSNSLANVIKKLIKNTKLLNQMSINSKKLYKKKFEFNKVYNKIILVLNNLKN